MMSSRNTSCLGILMFGALFLLVVVVTTTDALISQAPVSKLLQTHADDVAKLKQVCEAKIGAAAMSSLPYSNDVFFLRYCLESGKDLTEQTKRLESNLEWRTTGSGKTICDAATKALEAATSGGSGWNNAPVLELAPHSAIISQYITPSNVITTRTSQGDLVYCVRAGQIDDTALMSQVTVEQMIDFFLYTKEFNAQVTNQRSLATDELKCLITCNDLSGVKIVGGSADFRKALSASSNQANVLYPANAGPTLLLNLPKLLSALVKLFTPLFSAETKARLKFVQGPLKDVSDLQQIGTSQSGSAAQTQFVQQLDDIVYSS